MVHQGVEPWTFALLARRSNQLSYGANYLFPQRVKIDQSINTERNCTRELRATST